ncbi:tRNA(Ile)-lysidine synthetase [Psychromonas ingrahamii 37]|uniref:tRNA(Ile)-lysidine synthase n=1 Tax=Psychromonas ingrahamii (strain DSM 17664 / CCUG 51855 / 37) TaxID=357804 RepID=A1SYU7_PSYIN|nr:tRNA lysidine(34) synthetase TilS [Psychromonas ingrahamii]ABM04662.1 tRNA(Ile)-lysidine synthetase [Psychromonas ingrahamii 37]
MNKADLLNAFQAQLNLILAPKISFDQNFHIALSGGLDSVVLLHLFTRLRAFDKKYSLCAHHINHGLSDNAAHWQLFCENLCASLAVDFCCSPVILEKKNRTSLEALAREKRYACLTGNLLDNSYLITAHHQDDQLETVLLALKRGSGSTGLQGIQKMQKLQKGHLIRPLLNFSRQQLAAYAELFQLDWVEDESNQDQDFDRNFIRQTITPLLKERWPGMGKAVARSANICQEQQQLLDEIALADFNQLVEFSLNQQVLPIEDLAALSIGRRNNLLRFWFKKNQLDYPSAKQLQALWTDVALAIIDAQPLLQFKGYSVRRYRNYLYLVNDNKLAASIAQKIEWQGQDKIVLQGGLVELSFSIEEDAKAAGNLLNLDGNAKVEICFRCQLPANLACQPLGRKGSRSIKKLLHEYHVAPWLRDLVPFILLDGKLKMAVGLWSCQSEKTAGKPRYLNCQLKAIG